MPNPTPLFIYDGDCGICTATVEWLRRQSAGDVLRFAPSFEQPPEMLAAGLTLQDAMAAAYVIDTTQNRNGATVLTTFRGAAAINFALGRLPGRRNWLFRRLARLYQLPGVRQVQDLGYAWVAGNRHRLKVGPQVCAVPLAEVPVMKKPGVRLPQSIVVDADKAEVVGEYEAASARATAHERAIWGSAESMEGRLRWVVDALPCERINRWLDVGCGEAGLFALAEAAGHRFSNLVGVDLTPAMIDRARAQPLASPASFAVADLADLPDSLQAFDCITLIGVLQKCAVPPRRVFSALAPRLAPGGVMLLTTKNVTWKELTEGRLSPEPGHSWFAPHELIQVAESCGLVVSRAGGLVPISGTEVPLTESHEFFLMLTNGVRSR